MTDDAGTGFALRAQLVEAEKVLLETMIERDELLAELKIARRAIEVAVACASPVLARPLSGNLERIRVVVARVDAKGS